MIQDATYDKILEAKKTLNQAKKIYYSERFYEFNRDILSWPDIYEPLHRRVCNFIQDNIENKKILLLLPRGTFKSSIVTVGYALHRIAKNPATRILISNATKPMAVQFLGQVKNHLQRNDKFKDIFGDMSSSADSWREDRIYVEREKSYEQKEPTVWAQGTEANVVGSHFDLAILDDLVNDLNIGTKDQIEKVKQYYRGVLDLVDASPEGHKRVILIGTTWHWDDLYSWLQDPDTGVLQDFAVLKLPAYEGEWGEGNLLFPTRLNWKVLDELKRSQGNAHFSAQYMLNPIPTEDQLFKGPFKRYEQTDLNGVPLRHFIAVDPALSEEKYADYSAMVCVGVDKNNTWYIRDIWREKVQPNRLIDQIFYWYEKWKPISIGLETVAYQRMLSYQINDEMKKRGVYIPIKELKHRDMSKEDRIRGLQPRYEIGTVFHPERTAVQQIEYLEDELLRFPRSAHDDISDALASILELSFPVRVKEEDKHVRRNVYPA